MNFLFFLLQMDKNCKQTRKSFYDIYSQSFCTQVIEYTADFFTLLFSPLAILSLHPSFATYSYHISIILSYFYFLYLLHSNLKHFLHMAMIQNAMILIYVQNVRCNRGSLCMTVAFFVPYFSCISKKNLRFPEDFT